MNCRIIVQTSWLAHRQPRPRCKLGTSHNICEWRDDKHIGHLWSKPTGSQYRDYGALDFVRLKLRFVQSLAEDHAITSALASIREIKIAIVTQLRTNQLPWYASDKWYARQRQRVIGLMQYVAAYQDVSRRVGAAFDKWFESACARWSRIVWALGEDKARLVPIIGYDLDTPSERDEYNPAIERFYKAHGLTRAYVDRGAKTLTVAFAGDAITTQINMCGK